MLSHLRFYNCGNAGKECAGRVEEAGALSARIGREIQSRSRTQVTKFDGRTDVKRMWTAVQQLSGRQQAAASVVDGVTAEKLNEHYAAISTDQQCSDAG